MRREIPILEARLVPPDSRLRLEKKFKVEISAKKNWDSREVEVRNGLQSSKAPTTGLSEEGVYRQDTNRAASFLLDDSLSGEIICNHRGCHKLGGSRRTKGMDQDLLRQPS